MNSFSKFSRRSLVKMGLASAGLPLASQMIGVTPVAEGKPKEDPSFAAVAGQKGGQDVFGAYDLAKDWPKPLSGVPGNEKWTWGSGEGVFAESPNRVYMLQRGELPNIQTTQDERSAGLRAEPVVSDRAVAVARRDRGQPAGRIGRAEPRHRERGLQMGELLVRD